MVRNWPGRYSTGASVCRTIDRASVVSSTTSTTVMVSGVTATSVNGPADVELAVAHRALDAGPQPAAPAWYVDAALGPGTGELLAGTDRLVGPLDAGVELALLVHLHTRDTVQA